MFDCVLKTSLQTHGKYQLLSCYIVKYQCIPKRMFYDNRCQVNITMRSMTSSKTLNLNFTDGIVHDFG